jgi:tripartite-type tricarboxylate transporter receptor subunit TctC
MAVLLAALFSPVISLAQAYPAKTVRVVIPWPPGGSNDIVGRMAAQKLTEATGQQFIVDNRGGASGVLGAEVVAKSPPDGYTIMVHSTTHVGNAHLYGSKLAYNTLRDFAGVGLLSAQPGALTAHPSLPVKNVKEFIALAKSKPGQILYSSSGNGSAPHLQMALLISMAGIKLVHVPYTGTAQAATDLLGSRLQVMFSPASTVLQFINDGKLVGLASTGARRASAAPNLVTVSESGLPGYDTSGWFGLLAPAGTQREIIDRVAEASNEALKSPDITASLTVQGFDKAGGSPEDFAAFIREDTAKWTRVARAAGLAK